MHPVLWCPLSKGGAHIAYSLIQCNRYVHQHVIWDLTSENVMWRLSFLNLGGWVATTLTLLFNEIRWSFMWYPINALFFFFYTLDSNSHPHIFLSLSLSQNFRPLNIKKNDKVQPLCGVHSSHLFAWCGWLNSNYKILSPFGVNFECFHDWSS